MSKDGEVSQLAKGKVEDAAVGRHEGESSHIGGREWMYWNLSRRDSSYGIVVGGELKGLEG